MPTRIHVGTAAPYDVVVGDGLLGELPALLKAAQRVAVIHPTSLVQQARAVVAALAGFEVTTMEVPEGEANAQNENPHGAMCYYVVSKGDLVTFSVKIRSASFNNV